MAMGKLMMVGSDWLIVTTRCIPRRNQLFLFVFCFTPHDIKYFPCILLDMHSIMRNNATPNLDVDHVVYLPI